MAHRPSQAARGNCDDLLVLFVFLFDVPDFLGDGLEGIFVVCVLDLQLCAISVIGPDFKGVLCVPCCFFADRPACCDMFALIRELRSRSWISTEIQKGR